MRVNELTNKFLRSMASVSAISGHGSEALFHVMCFISGGTIVSGSSDNTVRVWDVKSNSCVLVLDSPHTDSVRCVQLKVYCLNCHSKEK